MLSGSLQQHPESVSRVFYCEGLLTQRSAKMNTGKTMMSLLLLSAVCVSPAAANWFSNPRTGTMLNIGSAPNPTPADLRRIGDTSPNRMAFQDQNASFESVAFVATKEDGRLATNAELTRMEGKPVFGAHDVRLGMIITVNHAARLAEVQTRGGIAVAMPVGPLIDKGKRVIAPTISPLDMMAMAKTQTGRTVAVNVNPQLMPARGSRV
jgi:hypothetical protein